jgi:hypothetical protein
MPTLPTLPILPILRLLPRADRRYHQRRISTLTHHASPPMKTFLLFASLMLALCRAASAADPAVPMADIEPRPASAPSNGVPMQAGLDDFAPGSPAAQQPPGPPAMGDLEQEYRGAQQPVQLLEGF